MSTVNANKVRVRVRSKFGRDLGLGNIVGKTNLDAMFKDNKVFDTSEDGYTRAHTEVFESYGAYPGSVINQDVIKLDSGEIVYRCNVTVEIVENTA